ncbi:MAG: 2OG-Fe(II) oxygenase, partial [Planctomycetes bacterium]|nr:2OG-Fe(II) oxygenase [Planctomycetota bacterium]
MSTRGFTVIDNFLDEEAWGALWTDFQFMELLPVSRTVGAWKLDDGAPLGGHEILTPNRDEELIHNPEKPRQYPTETALDAVITGLLAESEAFAPIVGDEWKRISARAYVYPHGTGLSWHRDDSEIYTGAFIYYAHPHWNAHWGGELMIADEAQEDLSIMAHRFENEAYSEALLERGMGHFIMPKPNRMVLLGGAPHAIAPVSPAAGQNVRASVV